MNVGSGRSGIFPRIVPGALIIKHLEKLDDRGVIATIQENPYMQFFPGLKKFTPHPVFDPFPQLLISILPTQPTMVF